MPNPKCDSCGAPLVLELAFVTASEHMCMPCARKRLAHVTQSAGPAFELADEQNVSALTAAPVDSRILALAMRLDG